MADSKKEIVLNPTKRIVERGEFSLMFSIRQVKTVDIVLAAKGAGYDCLYVDLEHGALTIPDAGQIFVTALAAGVTPFVRIPCGSTEAAQLVLDLGAMGIIAPHIGSPAEAERMAACCRFPPNGVRANSTNIPQQLLTNIPLTELQPHLERETTFFAMIESAAGLDNVEGIAAVKGVDALLVGTSDLCVELGIPGQFNSDKVLKAYERIIQAAKKNGKHVCGGGGIKGTPGSPVSMVKTLREMGMSQLSVGNDLSMLITAMHQRVREIKQQIS